MALTVKQFTTYVSSVGVEDADAVVAFCMDHEGRPLFGNHVDALLEFFPDGCLSSNWNNRLQLYHTFRNADYIFTDQLIDGKRSLVDDAVLLQLRQLYTYALIHLIEDIPRDRITRVNRIVFDRYAENVVSIREVNRMRSDSAEIFQVDKYSELVVDRSNTIIELVELIEAISATNAPTNLCSELTEYLVASQRVDDLSDWKEDLSRGHVTPFLWSIGGDISQSIEEKEREVYLSGVYELELSAILAELEKINNSFSEMCRVNHGILVSHVRHEIKLIGRRLQELVDIKLSFTDDASSRALG